MLHGRLKQLLQNDIVPTLKQGNQIIIFCAIPRPIYCHLVASLSYQIPSEAAVYTIAPMLNEIGDIGNGNGILDVETL